MVEGSAFPGFFDGFSVVIVVIVYVALIILSVIIYFVKKWRAGSGEEDSFVEGDDYDHRRRSLINDSKESNGLLEKTDSGFNQSESYGASIGKINKSSVDQSLDRSGNQLS